MSSLGPACNDDVAVELCDDLSRADPLVSRDRCEVAFSRAKVVVLSLAQVHRMRATGVLALADEGVRSAPRSLEVTDALVDRAGHRPVVDLDVPVVDARASRRRSD